MEVLEREAVKLKSIPIYVETVRKKLHPKDWPIEAAHIQARLIRIRMEYKRAESEYLDLSKHLKA